MATVISGPGGNCALPTGFNAKIQGWSGAMEMPIEDATGFSDNGWSFPVHIGPVAIKGSATAVGQFDDATTAPVPAALIAATVDFSNAVGAMTLTATTGCTYTFTGVISNVSYDRQASGKLNMTFDFESQGVVTQTWDETA